MFAWVVTDEALGTGHVDWTNERRVHVGVFYLDGRHLGPRIFPPIIGFIYRCIAMRLVLGICKTENYLCVHQLRNIPASRKSPRLTHNRYDILQIQHTQSIAHNFRLAFDKRVKIEPLPEQVVLTLTIRSSKL